MTHRSPALSSLADTLMKLSQNIYAETLLRTLGAFVPVWGTGCRARGRSRGADVVGNSGIEVLMADGSGLSRYNLVTADAMVAVLAHVYDDIRAPTTVRDTLPSPAAPARWPRA